jgi:hypothetical protein
MSLTVMRTDRHKLEWTPTPEPQNTLPDDQTDSGGPAPRNFPSIHSHRTLGHVPEPQGIQAESVLASVLMCIPAIRSTLAQGPGLHRLAVHHPQNFIRWVQGEIGCSGGLLALGVMTPLLPMSPRPLVWGMLFFFLIYLSYVSSCLQTLQKRASDLITDGCESPLEEQLVVLTSEPSLQPLFSMSLSLSKHHPSKAQLTSYFQYDSFQPLPFSLAY